MTRDQALTAVQEALTAVVPDADFATVPADAPLRDALELDSMDFLAFVEHLSERTGCRIEEDDYPQLDTLDASADFLTGQAP